jgi:integrase/recombinase XerD
MSMGALSVYKERGRWRLISDEGIAVEGVDEFLTALEVRGLSNLTVRAYAFDLLVLYRWLQRKKISVRELKHSDLLDFVKAQRKMGAQPTSINRRLIVTGLLYRFLTGEELAFSVGSSLPAPHYKGRGKDRDLGLHQMKAHLHRTLQVKTSRKIVEPLTAKQAMVLISSFKRYRDIAIVYLMLLCGLRSREVLSIKTGDVESNEKHLRISGKGGKERIMPLPTIILDYLHDYIRLERPSYCKTDVLFVVLQGNKLGHPMTTDVLGRKMGRTLPIALLVYPSSQRWCHRH